MHCRCIPTRTRACTSTTLTQHTSNTRMHVRIHTTHVTDKSTHTKYVPFAYDAAQAMLLAFDTLTRQHGPGPLTVSAEEVFNAMLQVNFSGISGQVVRSFVRSSICLLVCFFVGLLGWLVGLFVLLLVLTAYSVCTFLRLVCVYLSGWGPWIRARMCFLLGLRVIVGLDIA